MDLNELADRIEAKQEEELVAAVAAQLRCIDCGEMGDGSCKCDDGPFSNPLQMIQATIREARARGLLDG